MLHSKQGFEDLATASLLDCWIFWLLHAHEYEPEELLKLFPQAAIRLTTHTLTKISEVTEDKAMYDAHEKAIRDQQWKLIASRKEAFAEGKIEGEIKGEIKGKIETIRILQGILQLPISLESEFAGRTLEELQQLTAELQEKIRNRRSS